MPPLLNYTCNYWFVLFLVRHKELANPDGTERGSITQEVDDFMTAHPGIQDKPELILGYLQGLDDDVDNTQLLQAQLSYMFFRGPECPILYDLNTDSWFAWKHKWGSSAANLNRVKVFFQTEFLRAMREVNQLAKNRNTFPLRDGQEHPRVTFVNKLIASLCCRESVEKIVKEASMFFAIEAEFDMNPDILQLENCVVDLELNCFRLGRPSDMTRRSSAVHVPEKWLKDPTLIETEGADMRTRAWATVWSIFKREGEFHPDDHADILGEDYVLT